MRAELSKQTSEEVPARLGEAAFSHQKGPAELCRQSWAEDNKAELSCPKEHRDSRPNQRGARDHTSPAPSSTARGPKGKCGLCKQVIALRKTGGPREEFNHRNEGKQEACLFICAWR